MTCQEEVGTPALYVLVVCFNPGGAILRTVLTAEESLRWLAWRTPLLLNALAIRMVMLRLCAQIASKRL